MFDVDTYIRTKDLTGGPIITAMHDPLPPIEPATDENGDTTRAGMIGYLIAYGIGAAALAYWFML